MFAPGAHHGAHPGAPPGAPHGLMPIGAFVGGGFSPPSDPSIGAFEAMQRRYGWAAIVLAMLQILGLIITLSLWQTGNEAAAIVVLCVGYFATYFLVVLGSFLETEALDLKTVVQFHQLQLTYVVLKFLLIMQLVCIYLQRAIVPDLWVFGIAYAMFLVLGAYFIKCCHQHYKLDNTKKWYLLSLVICLLSCGACQTGYFIPFAIAYGKTVPVESILKLGALFVTMLFGQLSNICMIVMTKTWKVAEEVSGTEV